MTSEKESMLSEIHERRLEYYCGTLGEAVESGMFGHHPFTHSGRHYPGSLCPVCGWDSKSFKSQWIDLYAVAPEKRLLLESTGELKGIEKRERIAIIWLHVYDTWWRAYRDETGGSGWICVQCQECYSFFLLDVSS